MRKGERETQMSEKFRIKNALPCLGELQGGIVTPNRPRGGRLWVVSHGLFSIGE